MLWNSIIYALRLFRRDRLHSLVTLLGLTIGLACGIIILLFVTNELSYEAYHEKADRIYRVSQNFVTSGRPKKFSWTSPSLGPKLHQEFAQIETFTRLKYIGRVMFKSGDKTFYENHLAFADTNFFKVFTHQFMEIRQPVLPGLNISSLQRICTISISEMTIPSGKPSLSKTNIP